MDSAPSQPDAASEQLGGRVLGDSLQPPVGTLMKSIKPTKTISMLGHPPGILTKPIGVMSPRSHSPISNPRSPVQTKPATAVPGQLLPNASTISITASIATPRMGPSTTVLTTNQPSSTQDQAATQQPAASLTKHGVVPSLSLHEPSQRLLGMASAGSMSTVQRASQVTEPTHRLSTTGSASSVQRQGQLQNSGNRLSTTGSASMIQRQGTVRASPRPSSASPWQLSSPRQTGLSNSSSPRGSAAPQMSMQPRRAFVGSMSLAGKARPQQQNGANKVPPGSVSSRQLPEALVASRRESVAGSSTHRSVEDDGPGEARRHQDGSHLSLLQTLDADDQHDQSTTRSVTFNHNVLDGKPWRAAVLGQRGTVETHTRRMKEREEVFRSLSTWSKDVLSTRVLEAGHAVGEDGVLLEHVDAEQLELEARLVDESMRPDPMGLGYQLRAYWNATVQEEVELRFNKMREKWDADMAQEMDELRSLRGRVKELTAQHAESKDKLIALQLNYEMMVRQGIGRPTPPRPITPAPAPAPEPEPAESQPPEMMGAAMPQNQAVAEDSTAITTADALSFAEEVERLKQALANSKLEHVQAMDHAKTAMDALDITLKDRDKLRQDLERAKTELAIQGMHAGEAQDEMQKLQAELDDVKKQLTRAQNGMASPRTKAVAPVSPARNSSPANKGRSNSSSSPSRPATAGARQSAAAAAAGNSSKPGGAKHSLSGDRPATSSQPGAAVDDHDDMGAGITTDVEPVLPSRVGMHSVSGQANDLQAPLQEFSLPPSTDEPMPRVVGNMSSSGAAPSQAPVASLKAEAVHWQREAERLNNQSQALKQQLEAKAAKIEELELRLQSARDASPTLVLSTSSPSRVEAAQDPAMVARVAKVEAELAVARQQAKDLKEELAQTHKQLEDARTPPLTTNQLEVALEVERTRRMQLLHNLQAQIVQGLQDMHAQCQTPQQQQQQLSLQQLQAKLQSLHTTLQSLMAEQWEGLESMQQAAPHQQSSNRQGPGRAGAGRIVQLKVSDLQGLLANSTAKLQQLFELGGLPALLKKGAAGAVACIPDNPLLPSSGPTAGIGSSSYGQRLNQWLATAFNSGTGSALARHQPAGAAVAGHQQHTAAGIAIGSMSLNTPPPAASAAPIMRMSCTGIAAGGHVPHVAHHVSNTVSDGRTTTQTLDTGALVSGAAGSQGATQKVRPRSPKRMSVIGNESVTAARLGVYGTIAESSTCEVDSDDDSGSEKDPVLLQLPVANRSQSEVQPCLELPGSSAETAGFLQPSFAAPHGVAPSMALQASVTVQTIGGAGDTAPLKRLRPMSAAPRPSQASDSQSFPLQAHEHGSDAGADGSGVAKPVGTFARHHAAYVGHKAALPSAETPTINQPSKQSQEFSQSQGAAVESQPQPAGTMQPEAGSDSTAVHDGGFLGITHMSVVQAQRRARKGGDGGFCRSSAPVELSTSNNTSEQVAGKAASPWGMQQLQEAHAHAAQQVREQQQGGDSAPQQEEQWSHQGAGAAAQAGNMRWKSLPLAVEAASEQQVVGSPHSRAAGCIAAFAAKKNYASRLAADDAPVSPGTRLVVPPLPSSEHDGAPPVPLVVQQQIRADSPPHLHHNVYQAQQDQPAGAFKVRMLTATPQKGVQQRPATRPRPQSAALTLNGSTMLPVSLGLNLVEPGQGPPQLAPSPQPVLLSAQVGNTQGLAVPMRSWALYMQGAPAGGLLHVPGTERPVFSGIEMMSRAELVRSLRESQASQEQLHKKFVQLVQDMQRYEGVHDELAAEVAEARQHWVAENQYNAMLQEELERMQAILEIISHTASSIVDADEDAGKQPQPAGDVPPTSTDADQDGVEVSMVKLPQNDQHTDEPQQEQQQHQDLNKESSSITGKASLQEDLPKAKHARSRSTSVSPDSSSPRSSRNHRARSRSTSPDSPAFKRALSLKVDLDRIRSQQEEHLEKAETVAEGLGLPSPASFMTDAGAGNQKATVVDAASFESSSRSGASSPKGSRAVSPRRASASRPSSPHRKPGSLQTQPSASKAHAVLPGVVAGQPS